MNSKRRCVISTKACIPEPGVLVGPFLSIPSRRDAHLRWSASYAERASTSPLVTFSAMFDASRP